VLHRIRAVRDNENGFTLTELLITIVILGVLAGIVVFAVGAFSDDGVTVACETDKKNVSIAAEAYRAKQGNYPAGATDQARIQALVTAEYLKEPPDGGGDYTITLSTAGVVGPAACPT
jgi:prepilin-type N-terminal cleavage/methylation domain-containing protein